MVFLVLLFSGDEFDGGDDKERAEQKEHPREAGDDGRTDQNEATAQYEGDGDANGQHEFLQPFRHGEIRHDDDEHEQVIDA